jgi:hypothetical protein
LEQQSFDRHAGIRANTGKSGFDMREPMQIAPIRDVFQFFKKYMKKYQALEFLV